MVKLSVIETEKPTESLIIGRGVKDFAYHFRPYSRWPRGSQFKVFTTIAGTEISVDECHVNAEGEVLFRVKGDVASAMAFVKDWIEREGWKVESNPLTVTKEVIAKSEREAIERAEVETGGKTVYAEKIGEEKIDATLQLWRVTLEVPGVERIQHSDMSGAEIKMKRRSVRDALDNPKKETEFYVLVMRYYPMELRKRALKFEESPFDVWDRELAPSPELLSDVKKGVIDWSEYTRRFLVEVPPSLIKQKAKMYQGQAGGREVVFVCEEEEWEYPHCHTWILLDVISTNPDEESLATRRWRLRAEAEGLVKEIREEKAKHGL